MDLTVKNVVTVIGAVILLGGYVVGYFVFQATTQAQLEAHNKQILEIIDLQTRTSEKHTKAINSLNERLIRMEEREKMRR